MTLPLTIPPGQSGRIIVRFEPSAAGARNGVLTIGSNAAGSPHTLNLAGTGQAAPDPGPTGELFTAGNQIVDDQGKPVRIKSVSWSGMGTTIRFPHAPWAAPWKPAIDQMKAMGFNAIRLPFAGTTFGIGATLNTYRTSNFGWINPDMMDGDNLPKLVIECLDIILDYCASQGMGVILDYHSRVVGGDPPTEGSPVGDGMTLQNWLDLWGALATRYANHPAVIGADLFNEPWALSWAQWRAMAEQAGDVIHASAPRWLIFVEGVGQVGETSGTVWWWGGNLSRAGAEPVVLQQPNKLVYSPHEYGQSVLLQSWLQRPGHPVENWPLNLYPIWRASWGYLFEENIAPLWVGEFGGWFGYADDGTETKPYATEERQWLAELLKYFNGDFNGNGTRDLEAGKLGMSASYWCYGPNSSDTGGLIKSDWVTPQAEKIALLAPFLGAAPPEPGPLQTEAGATLQTEDGADLEV